MKNSERPVVDRHTNCDNRQVTNQTLCSTTPGCQCNPRDWTNTTKDKQILNFKTT